MTTAAVIDESSTTTDVDEAEALVRRLYPAASILDADDAFRFAQSVRGEGDVALARFECGSPACFEIDFGNVAAFGLLRSGDYRATSGSTTLDTSAPFVFSEGVGRSVSTEMDLLMVNLSSRALEPDGVDDPNRGAGGFASSRAASPELERAWRRTVIGAAEVLWDPNAFAQPIIRSTVLDIVRVTAVAAFPPRRSAADQVGTVSAAVRRAQQYIHDRAHEPVTISQLAAAARLSERGLHAAFQRELQETPHAYLRRVRLDGARAALRAADASDTTVAAIATAWGFAHLGRFSDRYRRAFGVYPAQDLRR